MRVPEGMVGGVIVPNAMAIYRFLSGTITDEAVRQACLMGMIPKGDLRDGVFYEGYCRLSTCARWSAKHQRFWCYNDSTYDTTPYPSDWDGLDLFVPVDEADAYDVACHFS